MGKRYSEIPDKLKQFIEDQKVFFVGTATASGRVNISPKGNWNILFWCAAISPGLWPVFSWRIRGSGRTVVDDNHQR